MITVSREVEEKSVLVVKIEQSVLSRKFEDD